MKIFTIVIPSICVHKTVTGHLQLIEKFLKHYKGGEPKDAIVYEQCSENNEPFLLKQVYPT